MRPIVVVAAVAALNGCAAVGTIPSVPLAARDETPPAFGRRCIPAHCVAPPSHIPDVLGRRALSAGRLAALGATAEFHHGLLAQAVTPAARAAGSPQTPAAPQ